VVSLVAWNLEYFTRWDSSIVDWYKFNVFFIYFYPTYHLEKKPLRWYPC